MSFFDVLGSIFEKWPMTDLTNVIVSMCLVSYNFCMIPHVLTVTFGLNLSGAWGVANMVSPKEKYLNICPILTTKLLPTLKLHICRDKGRMPCSKSRSSQVLTLSGPRRSPARSLAYPHTSTGSCATPGDTPTGGELL